MAEFRIISGIGSLLLLLSLLAKFVLSSQVLDGAIDLNSNEVGENEDIDEQFLPAAVNDTKKDGVNDNSSSVEKSFLLPHSVRPIHYKLEIIPLLFPVDDKESPYYNETRFNAPGRVWIEFACLEETSNVTLHAYKDMIIKNEQIQIKRGLDNENIPITNVTRDNDTDFLVLQFSNLIGSEAERELVYTLFIEFTARVADDRLNGIYLDYYIDPDSKEKKYLSTTLFAPHHARKAFPCFDEPGFKANFSISIGRKNDSGYSSISNMPLSNTKPIPELNGWVWDEFERTPFSLPTYLVALITTDFGFRQIKDGDLELRLHAPEYLIKRIKTLNTSLEGNVTRGSPYLLQDPLLFIATLLKMWRNTKLGDYPLPKVDVIALPHFYFNAMENMGAITFKYPVILNVENVTTNSELLRLSFVAGHEIVHQWFGNMLTPKSWTYVWLKESFSDLFARIFLSKTLYGAYKHNNYEFLNNELQRGMRFDGSVQTHPLENYVKSASGVGDIYTDIPYRKGASIMNMARNILTPSVFEEALETLFLEKKYSNIDQYDVFNHFELSQAKHNILKSQGLVGNITVTDILNSWTNQSGYPVVHIRKEGSNLLLKQEKYKNGLLKSLMDPVEEIEEYWYIPVTLYKTVESSSNKRNYSIQWLLPSKEETVVPLGEFSSITNVEGYFRILYGEAELHTILKELKRQHLSGRFTAYNDGRHSHSFSALERSQLLDDYFTFAFSKYEQVPISLLFHILSVILPYEKDLVVWNTFMQNIQKPYKLFQNTTHFPLLKAYLLKLLQPLVPFLDSQKPALFSTPCFHSSVVTKRIYFSQCYSKLLASLCAIDATSCSEIARKAVQTFMETEDISTVPADDQETIYCAAVKHASSPDELTRVWEFFQKMYFQEYYSVQRDRYLKALACTNNRDYLLKLLSWTTNETLDFHDIDRVTLFKNVIANPEGRDVILDFLDTNFDALYKSASVANPVTEALKTLVDYVNTEGKLEQMNEFINKHMDAMEKKKVFLEKQVKNARLNVLWMGNFAGDVHQSLEFQLQNTFADNSAQCDYETVQDIDEFISKITDYRYQ